MLGSFLACTVHILPCAYHGAGRLTQLSWSTNSELLAVVLTDAAAVDKQGNEDVVQIWHRSNWHWYLKQEQVYSGGQGVRVSWDEVAALRLHVASGAGWYRQVSRSYRHACRSLASP